jgi:TonB family protein
MGTSARRRKIVRRPLPPGEEPSLPQSVKVILPARHRIRPAQVAVALIPLLLLGAGGYFAYKKFSTVETTESAEEELQDVLIDVPPEPEPEPETEPETEAEPEADLPDLLAENEGATGPANAVSLDLALGTGSDGMAVGGAAAGGTGQGGSRAAFEPGQVDKNPEPAQEPSPPEMPRKALEQGVSGSFVATFVVNAAGRVESVEITGAPTGYGFEDAIRKSLLKRRYKPAMAGGIAVPVKIRQPFDFRLE